MKQTRSGAKQTLNPKIARESLPRSRFAAVAYLKGERRLDPMAPEGPSGPCPPVLAPIVPALGMEPGVAMDFGSERNDRMPVPIRLLAPGTAAGVGMLRMAVEPFDDAAFEGENLRFRPGLPAVELGDAGALVVEHPPVLGRPVALRRSEQGDNACLVAPYDLQHPRCGLSQPKIAMS